MVRNEKQQNQNKYAGRRPVNNPFDYYISSPTMTAYNNNNYQIPNNSNQGVVAEWMPPPNVYNYPPPQIRMLPNIDTRALVLSDPAVVFAGKSSPVASSLVASSSVASSSVASSSSTLSKNFTHMSRLHLQQPYGHYSYEQRPNVHQLYEEHPHGQQQYVQQRYVQQPMRLRLCDRYPYARYLPVQLDVQQPLVQQSDVQQSDVQQPDVLQPDVHQPDTFIKIYKPILDIQELNGHGSNSHGPNIQTSNPQVLVQELYEQKSKMKEIDLRKPEQVINVQESCAATVDEDKLRGTYYRKDIPLAKSEKNISSSGDLDQMEEYLNLPEYLFPKSIMLGLDPNSFIDHFCKLEDPYDNSGWILDLELGIPTESFQSFRTVAIFDPRNINVRCKEYPQEIHPEFNNCGIEFQNMLLNYYSYVLNRRFEGYMNFYNERNYEKFLAWVNLPIKKYGMCWP